MSDLFETLLLPEPMRAAVGDDAWIGAMLAFEAVLASSEAEAGLIPPQAAEAIAVACGAPERFDAPELGIAGRATGNPAAPLVRALTEAVEGDSARYVHHGATSQDVMDTAFSLVARGAVGLIDRELETVARRCFRLASGYRDTPMVGRTLLQQALPTTFGLKAAGWMDAALDARVRLAAVPLAVQLGGAAGTLASLGSDGVRVLGLMATGLRLDEPRVPWHTARARVAELGSALALAAGTVEKIATDITLMAQTEVGELAEAGGEGRGGSSTLPHKRNPVGSALAIACARRVRGEASILLEGMAQPHERAAGAWQAEWQALNGALACTGGAATHLAEALKGLEVWPDRMRANLELTDGLVMAEAVTTALAEAGMGRQEAHDLTKALAQGDGCFRERLTADAAVAERLSPEQIDSALDPTRYLGSAGAFTDRALARYREENL